MPRAGVTLAAICIFLIAAGFGASAAENVVASSGVEITGTVKDALSRPIEGAAISLQSASGKVLAVT